MLVHFWEACTSDRKLTHTLSLLNTQTHKAQDITMKLLLFQSIQDIW